MSDVPFTVTADLELGSRVEPFVRADSADVRNAFRVRNSNGDELQLAAIDRVDMDEWLAAVAETVADLRAAEDRVADQAERFKQESEN